MRPSLFMQMGKRLVLRFAHNRHISLRMVRDEPYLVVCDAVRNREIRHYFIRPSRQLEQLRPYFCDVRVFALETGNEIQDQAMQDNEDPWLYYLCKVRK